MEDNIQESFSSSSSFLSQMLQMLNFLPLLCFAVVSSEFIFLSHKNISKQFCCHVGQLNISRPQTKINRQTIFKMIFFFSSHFADEVSILMGHGIKSQKRESSTIVLNKPKSHKPQILPTASIEVLHTPSSNWSLIIQCVCHSPILRGVHIIHNSPIHMVSRLVLLTVQK